MAKKLYLEESIQDLADAIRSVNGQLSATYTVGEMASAVEALAPSGTMSIASNGIYDVKSFASVDVNVSGGGGEDVFAHLIDKKISGNVIVPSDITRVMASAFASCSALTGIKFTALSEADPYSAFNIQSSAFYGCTSLTYADFSYLTNVGDNAFKGCTKLESIIIRGTSATPPWTYTNSFSINGIYSVFVPSSQVDIYKANSKWSSIASRIFAIEDME